MQLPPISENLPREHYQLNVGGHCVVIEGPHQPDKLLDDPQVQQRFDQDEYMPYWAEVWPSAGVLVEFILSASYRAAFTGQTVLELGSGLGAGGIAALAAGAHTIFTDYEPEALRWAVHNARLNGFEQFDAKLLDWRHPPDEKFPIVIASDVLYETRWHAVVGRAFRELLVPTGFALLADPGRAIAQPFFEHLNEFGLCLKSEHRFGDHFTGHTGDGWVYVMAVDGASPAVG